MQETIYLGDDGKEKTLQEYFTAFSDKQIREKMESRFAELQEQGHSLKRRIKIGRNSMCPCGSGKKFKKCCISKVK